MSILLSNSRLKVEIRPDLGGRIDQITDLETGKDWLWHPSRYRGVKRNLPVGASFDDNWSGGWDEIFPNDSAGEFRGRVLADHGELWSQPWTIVDQGQRSATLVYSCSTVPVTIKKSIIIAPDGVNIRYLLHNQSEQGVPFLFKLHCALSIEKGDEILLPQCLMEPVDTGFSTIIGQAARTPFPLAYDKGGNEVRIDRIPGKEALQQEFFYASNLSQPWCGLKNSATARSFTFTYDPTNFHYVWVFGSYGRWKNEYVLVLEPSTNIPYDLETALKNGTCGYMGPGERKEMMVDMRLESTR
jgi:hypothetical protein